MGDTVERWQYLEESRQDRIHLYNIIYIYICTYIYISNIPKMIYVFVCVAYVRVKRYDEIS